MEYLRNVALYTMGPGLIPQIILTLIAIVALYVIITVFESIAEAVRNYDNLTTVLFDETTGVQQLISQSPDSAKLINNSVNEANGMEFSYSMYIFIDPDTFENSTTTTKLKHIMHKGVKDAFPLMAPGLFVHNNKNTLRLYMNSVTKWDDYVEIPNVPIAKWFHLVISMSGKYLDVFVNGNITVRQEYTTIPKLNAGDIYVMYPLRFPRTDDDLTTTGLNIEGPMRGMISRLKYYAFALNYSQIDSLYREGPSKKIITKSYTETPPYFRDDWWVTRY
jgi:hypothetical protein